MQRIMLKAKLHRVTVTEADFEYEGSCAVDPNLMEAAGLLPFEKVEIWNLTNGERFETYLIDGERGTGQICVNGAAARKASPGDLVIMAVFCVLDEKELETHEPVVVLVDRENNIKEVIRHQLPVMQYSR